ncbi:hypothetical protein HB779_14790 [Phyllobacterium sp. 628]|uniref:COG3904 family protein n=1 Tax=Phyllobacterium sp. 628 TaxID=2718938 RepID=UPI0016626247|nr:hypothetical protein [Phyllobacterium sp. 628]QND53028.1 hypothetical protein HB779_14790 [Phyllobacterium sp. 628]
MLRLHMLLSDKMYFTAAAVVLFVMLTGAAEAQQQSCNLACPAWTLGGTTICNPANRCAGVPAYGPILMGGVAPQTQSQPEQKPQPEPSSIPPATTLMLWTIADEPMSFVIARADVAVCRPNCPEWVAASGTIKPDTPSKLRKVLKQLGKRRLPIIIDSRGGAVDAAIEMGRIIRKRALDVAVAKTMYFGCEPGAKGCKPDFSDGAYSAYAYPGGAICMSACPFFAAGGIKRLIGFEASVGIHQITTTVTNQRIMYQTRYQIIRGKKRIIDRKILSREATGTYQTTELRKGYRKRLSAYFSEMGVDASIVERMLAVAASDIYVMKPDELSKFRFATHDGDSRTFTPGKICNNDPKPDNCIELKLAGSKI